MRNPSPQPSPRKRGEGIRWLARQDLQDLIQRADRAEQGRAAELLVVAVFPCPPQPPDPTVVVGPVFPLPIRDEVKGGAPPPPGGLSLFPLLGRHTRFGMLPPLC